MMGLLPRFLLPVNEHRINCPDYNRKYHMLIYKHPEIIMYTILIVSNIFEKYILYYLKLNRCFSVNHVGPGGGSDILDSS